MDTEQEGPLPPPPPSATQTPEKEKKRRLTVNQELTRIISTYYPQLTYEGVASYGFRLVLLDKDNVQDPIGVTLTDAEKSEVRRQTIAKRQQVSGLLFISLYLRTKAK